MQTPHAFEQLEATKDLALLDLQDVCTLKLEVVRRQLALAWTTSNRHPSYVYIVGMCRGTPSLDVALFASQGDLT